MNVYDVSIRVRVEAETSVDAEDMVRDSILSMMDESADDLAEELGAFDVSLSTQGYSVLPPKEG